MSSLIRSQPRPLAPEPVRDRQARILRRRKQAGKAIAARRTSSPVSGATAASRYRQLERADVRETRFPLPEGSSRLQDRNCLSCWQAALPPPSPRKVQHQVLVSYVRYFCKMALACVDLCQAFLHRPPLIDSRFLLIVTRRSAPLQEPAPAVPAHPAKCESSCTIQDKLARMFQAGPPFTLRPAAP